MNKKEFVLSKDEKVTLVGFDTFQVMQKVS